MKRRILLVDNEEYMHRGLRRDLASLDCELEVFSKPESALARAREASFDLVIANDRMHGMDGLTMVMALKQNQPGIIAIMLKSSPELNLSRDAIKETEVYRVLTKPLDSSRLLVTIRESLEQHAEVNNKQPAPVPARQRHSPDGAMTMLEAKYPGITQPGSDWKPDKSV